MINISIVGGKSEQQINLNQIMLQYYCPLLSEYTILYYFPTLIAGNQLRRIRGIPQKHAEIQHRIKRLRSKQQC